MTEEERQLNKILKEKIITFCQDRTNIMTVYIFGSYGTKYENNKSDLDLAILFNNLPDLMEQMQLAGELELHLREREIDLINLNKANILLQHRILIEGEKVFDRDPLTTADFFEKVLKFAPDFKIRYRQFQDDYITGLKEELQ